MVTDALRVSARCACTDLPHLAATASGTETSFATETELDVASSQIGSEKDALATTDASAMSKTVPLNSSHVIPEIASDTATTGARVGFGVGTGAGKDVDGTGFGEAVGGGVGAGVSLVVGTADDGRGDGAADDAAPRVALVAFASQPPGGKRPP